MSDGLIKVIRLKQKGLDYMIDNKTPVWIGVFLIATMVIAGCTSPSATPPVQTPAPTTAVQTVVPTTI
jgi:hypothetical protein